MSHQLQLPGLFLPRIIPTPPDLQPELQSLRSFPRISPAAKSVFAKRFSLASEQLCDSLLTRMGSTAFLWPISKPTTG